VLYDDYVDVDELRHTGVMDLRRLPPTGRRFVDEWVRSLIQAAAESEGRSAETPSNQR
jgi:hypothetical protein